MVNLKKEKQNRVDMESSRILVVRNLPLGLLDVPNRNQRRHNEFIRQHGGGNTIRNNRQLREVPLARRPPTGTPDERLIASVKRYNIEWTRQAIADGANVNCYSRTNRGRPIVCFCSAYFCWSRLVRTPQAAVHIFNFWREVLPLMIESGANLDILYERFRGENRSVQTTPRQEILNYLRQLENNRYLIRNLRERLRLSEDFIASYCTFVRETLGNA